MAWKKLHTSRNTATRYCTKYTHSVLVIEFAHHSSRRVPGTIEALRGVVLFNDRGADPGSAQHTRRRTDSPSTFQPSTTERCNDGSPVHACRGAQYASRTHTTTTDEGSAPISVGQCAALHNFESAIRMESADRLPQNYKPSAFPSTAHEAGFRVDEWFIEGANYSLEEVGTDIPQYLTVGNCEGDEYGPLDVAFDRDQRRTTGEGRQERCVRSTCIGHGAEARREI